MFKCTFKYEYDFLHVIKAWEPSGDIEFNAEALRPYIKPDGGLSFMLK